MNLSDLHIGTIRISSLTLLVLLENWIPYQRDSASTDRARNGASHRGMSADTTRPGRSYPSTSAGEIESFLLPCTWHSYAPWHCLSIFRRSHLCWLPVSCVGLCPPPAVFPLFY
eukprot:1910022-Pleurochrysis_carterae.AAC.1